MNDLEFQGYEPPFLAKNQSFQTGFVYLYRNGAIMQGKVDPSSGKYIVDLNNQKIMTLPDFYNSPFNYMQQYLKNNYKENRVISNDPVIKEIAATAAEEKNNDAAWEEYKQKNPMRTGLGLVNKDSFTRKQANGATSWWPFGGRKRKRKTNKRKRSKKR